MSSEHGFEGVSWQEGTGGKGLGLGSSAATSDKGGVCCPPGALTLGGKLRFKCFENQQVSKNWDTNKSQSQTEIKSEKRNS